ncbi:MAG: carboxypeptidase-like regulatory domain-containing protein [Bacteroidota bacterium]|nr:carboxypeptidase-like regulatory domain-containing protein [Bacteroidota bacterium]
MKTKQIFLILIIAISTSTFFACDNDDTKNIATGNLSITVLDTVSKPVYGAEVKVLNNIEYTSTTDVSGRCTFNNLMAINSIVRIKKDSFKSQYGSFFINEGENSQLFTLEAYEGFSEGFESGEFSGQWVLTSTDNELWFVTDTESHTGNYCVQAGDVGYYDECILLTTVVVEDESMLSFWYKNSNNYSYISLLFAVDGNIIFSDNGTNSNWEQYQTILPAGTYQLSWIHTKESSYISNCVWVDDISLICMGK